MPDEPDPPDGKAVVAYMTTWCPDCGRSRRLMQRLGVRYTEIDIERVDGAEAEMLARNGGSDKVPTIVVGEEVLIEPSDTELSDALAA